MLQVNSPAVLYHVCLASQLTRITYLTINSPALLPCVRVSASVQPHIFAHQERWVQRNGRAAAFPRRKVDQLQSAEIVY